MYRVAEFEASDVDVDRTMFRSFSADECWSYVRSRLEVSRKSEERAPRLYVQYKDGTFIDEPQEILALRNMRLG